MDSHNIQLVITDSNEKEKALYPITKLENVEGLNNILDKITEIVTVKEYNVNYENGVSHVNAPGDFTDLKSVVWVKNGMATVAVNAKSTVALTTGLTKKLTLPVGTHPRTRLMGALSCGADGWGATANGSYYITTDGEVYVSCMSANTHCFRFVVSYLIAD